MPAYYLPAFALMAECFSHYKVPLPLCMRAFAAKESLPYPARLLVQLYTPSLLYDNDRLLLYGDSYISQKKKKPAGNTISNRFFFIYKDS
jgi:hypothetical protein